MVGEKDLSSGTMSFDQSYKESGTDIGFYLGSKLLEKGLNKALPGGN